MLDVSKEIIKMIVETREVRALLSIDPERTRTTWDMISKFSKMVASGQINKDNFDLQGFFQKYARQLDSELGLKQVTSVKQIPPNVGEVIVHGTQYVVEPIEVDTYENPPDGLSNYLK